MVTIDNGVVCDATLLAAPGVVCAGDVTRWPNPLFDGELMRLEHWTNATEQGVHAARRLLAGDAGTHLAFEPVPFVWSDQYDWKVQVAGQRANAAAEWVNDCACRASGSLQQFWPSCC